MKTALSKVIAGSVMHGIPDRFIFIPRLRVRMSSDRK